MIKPYITLPQAAKMLNISAPTLKRLIEDRKISYSRIGMRYRFKPEDISAYIQGCTFDAKNPV